MTRAIINTGVNVVVRRNHSEITQQILFPVVTVDVRGIEVPDGGRRSVDDAYVPIFLSLNDRAAEASQGKKNDGSCDVSNPFHIFSPVKESRVEHRPLHSPQPLGASSGPSLRKSGISEGFPRKRKEAGRPGDFTTRWLTSVFLTELFQANGTAEREAALVLLERHPATSGSALFSITVTKTHNQVWGPRSRWFASARPKPILFATSPTDSK